MTTELLRVGAALFCVSVFFLILGSMAGVKPRYWIYRRWQKYRSQPKFMGMEALEKVKFMERVFQVKELTFARSISSLQLVSMRTHEYEYYVEDTIQSMKHSFRQWCDEHPDAVAVEGEFVKEPYPYSDAERLLARVYYVEDVPFEYRERIFSYLHRKPVPPEIRIVVSETEWPTMILATKFPRKWQRWVDKFMKRGWSWNYA